MKCEDCVRKEKCEECGKALFTVTVTAETNTVFLAATDASRTTLDTSII